MNCSFCKKRAIYLKSTNNEYFCEECLVKYVERKFKTCIRKNNMISKNDKIAICISGGKDSSVLLFLMNMILNKRKDVKYFAIILDEGIKGYREKGIKSAKKLCKILSIPLYAYSFKKELGIRIDRLEKKKTCTYCGVFRRYLLNKKALELGAKKIFVGHNLDDEAQSVMMNFLRGDYWRFIRLGPAPYKKKKGFVPRFKPLVDISERETMLYAMVKKIPHFHDECPHSFDHMRRDVSECLNKLEEKYPGIKQNIVRFYERIKKHLPEWKGEVKKCKICKEPTSRKMCKACELLNNLKE